MSFRLVMDSMTHEERERAEWVTGEPGRGRFYMEGYEAGRDDGFEEGRDYGLEAGYDEGRKDGYEAGIEDAAAFA